MGQLNKRNIAHSLLMAVVIFITASCSTINPEGEVLKISAQWDKQLNIMPMDAKDIKVYLRTKNSSGSDVGEEIKKGLKRAIMEEGYLLTSTKADAAITVRADVHYFGRSKGDAKHYGKIIGAVAGGATGVAVADKEDRVAAGAGGALIGAGLGYLADNLVRENKLDLVTHVIVHQIGQETQVATLVASAEKRQLTELEATPGLSKRLIRSISNILP